MVLNYTIIITENCNLACKYCYVPHLKEKKVITKEVIEQIFNMLEKDINLYDGYQLDLFGGEPLTAWEETKMIMDKGLELKNKYPNKKVHLTLFTNLILFNEDKINYVKNNVITSINFSLDGCKKANDSARVFNDGSGTYDIIMKNVKKYQEINDLDSKYIIFKSVIAPSNVDYVLESAKEIFNLGYKRFAFSLARDDVWDKDSIEKYKVNMKQLADFFIEHIDEDVWYDIFSSSIANINTNKCNLGYCGAGRDLLSICPDGFIYPCQRFYNSRSPYKIGDVYNGMYKDNTWYNVFQKYTLNNMIGCSNCDTFNYNCPGQCIAAMYESSKNIFKPISSVCELIKINYELANYINEKLKNNVKYKENLNKYYKSKNR